MLSVICNHTSHDEHDAGSEAHLALRGIFHVHRFEALQGEN